MEEKKKERRGSVPHLITMLKGGGGSWFGCSSSEK